MSDERVSFQVSQGYRARVHADTPSHVRYALRESVDPILHDLTAMFQMPMPLEARYPRFHFSISLGLIAIVAGTSRLLFDPNRDLNDGQAFKQCAMLIPWDQEPLGSVSGESAVKILYDEFRNPWAHALGVSHKGKSRRILRLVRMAPWTPEELARLNDRQKHRPPGWPPTIQVGENTVQINLDCLHWGVRALIYALTSDLARMETAQVALEKLDHPFGNTQEYKRLAFGEDVLSEKKNVLSGSSIVLGHGALPTKGAIGPTPRASWSIYSDIWPWNKRAKA